MSNMRGIFTIGGALIARRVFVGYGHLIFNIERE